MFEDYIEKENLKNLKDYKYVGEDKSLSYKYVLSPLAQFCVDYLTPIWMAPNLVNLIFIDYIFRFYLLNDKLHNFLYLCLRFGRISFNITSGFWRINAFFISCKYYNILLNY